MNIVELCSYIIYNTGPFLGIFQWKGQLRKRTSGRKRKVENYLLVGGMRPSCRKCLYFWDLQTWFPAISAWFLLIFRQKRTFTRGRGKTLWWGGHRGWGALVSLVYMSKKALLQHICSSGIGPTSYPGHFAYKWERELDHLHHTAKDNGFINFSFTIRNNNGFNAII